MSRVDASALSHRRVSTLSGGERQRVMIARMLATGAGLLLMDEPTAALDVGQVLALHALLHDLAEQGRGIVIAMHDLNAARALADEAICLDRRDDTGQHHHGPASDILGPEVLAQVFGVGVTEVDGRLRFTRQPG
ncbi:MAG: ABC transporter ATP-binding protein [Nannocystaceae bacterium]|nr:ABC transporter ATP-binding protein [Nannocystaceae bacterium]